MILFSLAGMPLPADCGQHPTQYLLLYSAVMPAVYPIDQVSAMFAYIRHYIDEKKLLSSNGVSGYSGPQHAKVAALWARAFKLSQGGLDERLDFDKLVVAEGQKAVKAGSKFNDIKSSYMKQATAFRVACAKLAPTKQKDKEKLTYMDAVSCVALILYFDITNVTFNRYSTTFLIWPIVALELQMAPRFKITAITVRAWRLQARLWWLLPQGQAHYLAISC
jgi:hypothetical protein